MNRKTTIKLAYSALCLALCFVLPLLTGQIPQIGAALSPMHIPAFLCGFLCGPVYGTVIGLIAPVLRSLIFGGMPPLYPTAIAMSFELAAYGLTAGLLFRYLPKKIIFVYVALIASMLVGRLVWGFARFIMASIDTSVFTFEAFLAGAFVDAVPGIICHIILVPILVIALDKAGLIPEKRDD